MPPIRSLVSKCHTYTVILILLLSVIMPIYSYYTEKKLVYIVITALSGYQPFFYFKCIKSNMRFSYNIKLVFNAKCIFFMHLCSL